MEHSSSQIIWFIIARYIVLVLKVAKISTLINCSANTFYATTSTTDNLNWMVDSDEAVVTLSTG